MTLLAGWVETTITGKDAELVLQKHIDQSLNYTKNDVRVESSTFYVLAINPKKIKSEQQVILVNAGNTSLTDSANIIENYQKNGDVFLEKSPVEQAIVIIDPDQKKLLLATDPIGLTNLYYALTNNGLVFGTSADSVIAHPEVKADISAQSVYDYVYFHHVPVLIPFISKSKNWRVGRFLSIRMEK